MKELSIAEYKSETVNTYLKQLNFFNNLLQNDPVQFALVMQHTRILELEAGEVLIEKGTIGNIFYSLVSGQLAIFPDKRPGETAICELVPSQILGALSIINQLPRTATVMASSINGTVVFCTDFTIFGELHDFSSISLRTKLIMFRDVVEKIHGTLKFYEIENPDIDLSQELHTLIAFHGEYNSVDELDYLSDLAIGMAWLLDRWNKKIVPKVALFDEAKIEQNLKDLMKIPRN